MEKENEEMRLDLGMEVRERIGTVVVAIDHFIISIFRVFIFILFYIKFFFSVKKEMEKTSLGLDTNKLLYIYKKKKSSGPKRKGIYRS